MIADKLLTKELQSPSPILRVQLARNRRRHFGLRCNLMAALYNYELSHSADAIYLQEVYSSSGNHLTQTPYLIP